MAEKSGELMPREDDGILSKGDKEIISTVADTENNREFTERYSDHQTDDQPISETENANSEDVTEETEQLRAQIEETRKGMGETIDAIQEKLSISNISEQVKDQVTEQISNAYETAKDTIYGSTIGKLEKAGKFMKNIGNELSKTDFGEKARKNPFPLFLIGLGVGLLAFESFGGGSRRKRSFRYEGRNRNSQENYNRGSANKSLLKSAQNRLGGVYETVSGATGSAYESASGAVGSAYENVSGTASNAYSGISDYAGRAYERAGDYSVKARESYDHYIEESPLAVGAVALAVGAAVGLAIPSTSYEGELFGEYREQVFDKAQTAATNLFEQVKSVANETVQNVQETVKETVREESKAQGLT